MKTAALIIGALLTATQQWAISPAENTAFPRRDSSFVWTYDMENPAVVFDLENELREISGLSIVPGKPLLAAIQDEEGDIYLLEKNTGKIVQQTDFWKDGDYEGVEAVGDLFFAVNSSGTVYEIQSLGKNNQQTFKYNYFLNEDYDAEGLAYDPFEERLLLVCKGKAGEAPEFDFRKAFYAFDLKTKALQETPALVVSIEDIQDYLNTSPAIRKFEKLVEFFSPNQSSFIFSPSGIAVHPQTGHYYVLSTAGKILVVLDRTGRILHIEKLDKKSHPQPEGICFDTDGTLYIANEADGGTARIFKFHP